jgi:hypothetical protein
VQAFSLQRTGAGEGNRTPDPLLTRQLLYRLSYASEWNNSINYNHSSRSFGKKLSLEIDKRFYRRQNGRLYFGGVPERSKGADCKSVGTAFEGSNPSPSTKLEKN